MDLKSLRISDKKILVLNSMGIHEVYDLLTYYPFRYENIEVKPRLLWEKDDKIVFEAIIVSRARVLRLKGNMTMTRFSVLLDEEVFDITIFNRPWVSSFKIGSKITIFGKFDGGKRITASQYNTRPLCEQIGMHPIYNCKDGVTQKELYKFITKAWDVLHDEIVDFIPVHYRKKYRLIDKKTAIYGIHFPENEQVLKQSLRHLKYEEFLKFQIAMASLKESEVVKVAQAKQFLIEDVFVLEHSFPFSLTKDQRSTIEDILNDLKSEKVMYRMVQGDVGCGKTLVAAFGMYACVLAKKQAALMAPTEILAKQHVENLKQMFCDVDVVVEGLYGSLKASDKQVVLQRLKNHEIDILVGTHALFQEHVEFYDLGMVVADEQHRFGVEQRRRLLEKGEKVDFLLMSATPIPRTLALSIYGDMDVSTIATMPNGRTKTITKYIPSSSMSLILEDVLKYVDEGNQCYVVCPAIEKNDEYVMRNVIEIYEGMQQILGKRYRIGLLHGKMSAAEKDEVMSQFVQGRLHFLVSTTVIEVGVDVKDANIMVIYDAHRFGLSQIHQLRGRVGRGNKQGYCYLLSSSKDDQSVKRMKILESVSDGFEISQEDLKLRGPGDLLGTRQSGVPSFILGDIVQDFNILEVARTDAFEILQHLSDFADIEKYIDELRLNICLD